MRRKDKIVFLTISLSVLWGLVVPSAFILDGLFNRPLCGEYSNIELSARVLATYTSGDEFYVYLSEHSGAQVFMSPQNYSETEYRLIHLDHGGVIDICILAVNQTGKITNISQVEHKDESAE